MSEKYNPSFTKRQIVEKLSCGAVLCLLFVSSYTPYMKSEVIFELLKPSNILGYIRLILSIYCLVYIRKESTPEKNKMWAIIVTYVIGDIIDFIDGPIAKYTKTESTAGEFLDHAVFDKFREPFEWLVLVTIYPEFTTFWHILLFRMFIQEDKTYRIPRVPILPLFNVAWYFPVIVILRYVNIKRSPITKVIQVYLACVFLTWRLEGGAKNQIHMDWYLQCYLLRQDDACEWIQGINPPW